MEISEASRVADALFADPRLADIYDALDSDRSDLNAYLALVEDLRANSVLDVGCGTGTFACLLAARGLDLTGVDPALASLDVARRKPHADKVRWAHADATSLPDVQVDLATMTGNVAQVFLDDHEWASALAAVHKALRPGGWLVFEIRNPARRNWEEWTRDQTYRRLDIPGVDVVETWVDLTGISMPFVSFRHTCIFQSDGVTLTSDSRLRFRDRSAVEEALAVAGYDLIEVRDAPDRPGKEFVFIAQKPGA